MNSISMIAYSTLNILIAAGLIMMVSQRVLIEVQTEKDKYTKAFHSSPYSLILTKVSDGRIFEVNEGFVRITGYQPEEVLGKTTLDLGIWANPEDRTTFISDLATDAEVREKQVKFRSKNGSIIIGLLSASKIAAFGEDCILTSVSDITELIQIKDRLEDLAMHDALTGLPNRYLFYDRAAIAIANAKRDQEKVAIVSMDVDFLKTVNDRFGHAVGDQILKAVSNRLSKLLRRGDTISRFGGDEFVVLLSGVSQSTNVGAIAKKILASISSTFEIGLIGINITASAGIALYPDDDSEIDALIKKSDEAMYQVKTNGRNGFRFYSDIG